MSQYPPQPPMYPPGQQPMYPAGPPYGAGDVYPPMTPGSGGTSGAAVASLICGILGCVPFLTSLLAIILGFVGIRQTRNSRRGGRGMAIAGLILGLLGLLGWASFAGIGVWGLAKARTLAGNTAKPFVQAVIDADYAKAATYSSMSEAEMTALHEQINGWGNVTSMSVNGVNAQKNVGSPDHIKVSGRAQFESAGEKTFDTELEARGGAFKVVDMAFK